MSRPTNASSMLPGYSYYRVPLKERGKVYRRVEILARNVASAKALVLKAYPTVPASAVGRVTKVPASVRKHRSGGR